MFKKTNLYGGGAYLFAALMMVSNTAGAALEANRNVVDGFLGTRSTMIVTEEGDEELWATYTADYENTDDLVAKHEEMGAQMEEEGAVLLKNQGVLPLTEDVKKVTLLGMRADAQTLYGATIGVSVPAAQNVSLTTALTDIGIEVNPVSNEIYDALGESDAYKKMNALSPSFSGVTEGGEPLYAVAEPTVSELEKENGSFMDSIAEYSDAAIVVVGRPSSEAADYYPGETGVHPASGARSPLALSTHERDIIRFAEENFDKVIVLVNSSNTMELGDLEKDEDLDAILWIGLPGNHGMRGVANILYGEVNPSGATPDLYASDTTSTPAMANYGVMTFSNASDYLNAETDRGEYYLIEAEGIYTGYRYYETRYADLVMGQGKADSTVGAFDSTGAWNYAEEVIYPFGYGLSYTTFEKTLDSLEVSTEDKTIKAAITVKNTGDVAGKTSVQLYGQAPYIEGGVEKSAVQLVDYGKTQILEPGESETIEITADLENLTSYDEKEAESYTLDGGDYYFTVADGSHQAINNMLAKQGYSDADGMDAEGDADNVQVWSYDPEGGVDAETFKITENGTEVSNHLQDADMNYWQDGTVTYLSRSDWEGTWPKTYEGLTITEMMVPYLTNDFYEIRSDDDTSSVTLHADNGLAFSATKGSEYEDEIWDQLLDQLDLQEAAIFITQGNRAAPAMESVGFSGGQYTENGPGGFNTALSTYSNPDSPWYVSEDDPNVGYQTNDTGCAPLLAATFNKEFANEFGVLWGNDSLFNGLPFIWAPGLNLHRSAYNGRNGEYYSEDPVLAGTIGLSVISGGLEKGLIMAPKHFAFNDQESNRNGVAPFMTEQKARELELRSFQIAVEGGTLGMMTSFSRIGATYVGAHKGLMTDILKNEWGFKGYAISDMVNPGTYMTWKESVIAGTTSFDTKEPDESWASYLTLDDNHLSGDAQMLQAVKDAVHGTLYAYSRSNMMNSINSSTRQVSVNTWWRKLYKGGTYGGAALMALCILGYLLSLFQNRKKEENAK